MKNKEIKFETLKKSHKKYIIGGIVAVCIIGSALTFRLTHSKYRVTQSIDLGSGVINYKVPDFKIMAMYQQKDGSICTEDNCYNELTGRMPSSGYVINESKSYCNLNGSKDTEAKLYTNSYGEHVVSNFQKSEKCYLYFDRATKGGNYILAKLGTNVKTTTPDFSKTATTDEGVYGTSDGMYGGTTYYWRGKVENNHVIFANKCWRIIRINGDKTIRLIYNGGVLSNNTCPGNGANANSIAVKSQAYHSSDNQSNYVGWTYSGTSQIGISSPSNAKTQIETWYTNNLASYANKIADGKYCNDRETANGYTWAINGNYFEYAAYGRLRTSSPSPTFNCTNSGDVYTLKVGLITADEVIFAGGLWNKINQSYYLYNDEYCWTMSPSSWSNGAYMFHMGRYGAISEFIVSVTTGIRPVINLRSDVIFSSGDGTISKPYVVS